MLSLFLWGDVICGWLGWPFLKCKVDRIQNEDICFFSCVSPKGKCSVQFSSVHLCSRARLFVTPWTLDLPVSNQVLEFTQTHVHQVGDAI